MPDANSLLLPALIFVTAGFLMGILVMTIMNEHGKRKEKESPDDQVSDEQTPSAEPALPANKFDNIASLYREKSSGKLLIDIRGKVHLTRSTIPADQLRDLQEASRNWETWLGLPQSVKPDMPVPVKPPTPVPTVRTNPTTKSTAPENQSGPTIVMQIEAILQEKLPRTPYAGQNIHLEDEPPYGVIVWVGAQKYVGIDTVPDEGIKNLIQSAVREWEKTGGLD